MGHSEDIWLRELEPHGRWLVAAVTETTSTNAVMLAAAEAGAVGHRTVLRADHQTAGRGRLDRRWDAPTGTNVLASIFLADDGDASTLPTQRVGLAVAAAARGANRALSESSDGGTATVPNLTVAMKWPNDVVVGNAKLAGVLAQRSSAAHGVVVGFGVNLRWAPEGAVALDDIADGAVGIAPAAFLRTVLDQFDALPASAAALAARYRAELATLGQVVRVELPDGSAVRGTAVDLDDDGRLIVQRESGEMLTFDVGDVVHLRPQQRR